MAHQNNANAAVSSNIDASNPNGAPMPTNPTPPGPAAPAPAAPNPPNHAALAQMTQEVATMTTAIDPGWSMTIGQRNRLPKLRPGAVPYIDRVVAIAEEHGLTIPGLDPTAIKDDIALVADLDALLARVDSLRGLVADLNRHTQSRVWKAGTTTYSMLTRLVLQIPSLQAELEPIAAFFATKHKGAPAALRKQEVRARSRTKHPRKKKAKPGAPATTGTSPVPSPAEPPPASPPHGTTAPPAPPVPPAPKPSS